MEKRNTLGTKFPKMNINKKSTLKVSTLLLGMIALSVALKAGYNHHQNLQQQKKEAAEYDRATMATLINTKIVEGDNDTNHVIFWLDTNNDLKTAEGHCSMPDAPAQKALHISNLTNGTTKSLAEWRKISHPYEVQYHPSKFPPSR